MAYRDLEPLTREEREACQQRRQQQHQQQQPVVVGGCAAKGSSGVRKAEASQHASRGRTRSDETDQRFRHRGGVGGGRALGSRGHEAARAAMLSDGYPLRELDLKTLAMLDNVSSTNSLLFHPYEPLLMVADNRGGISAFDHERSLR